VFAGITAGSVAVPVMTSVYVAGLVEDGDGDGDGAGVGHGAGVRVGVVVVLGCTETLCLHNACNTSVVWPVSAGRSGLWVWSQMSVSVATWWLLRENILGNTFSQVFNSLLNEHLHHFPLGLHRCQTRSIRKQRQALSYSGLGFLELCPGLNPWPGGTTLSMPSKITR
jgi:hypothetical protein